jgi:hypothetical protein
VTLRLCGIPDHVVDMILTNIPIPDTIGQRVLAQHS